MSRWWRAYDEALDDPKLQKLGLEMIGAWFNLLCMASRNNGAIMVADVPFSLRVPKAKAAEVITRLVTAGLLDRKGNDYEPHKWGERQFKSDGSTERVKRFRKQERNVSCNVSETETKRELKRQETKNETGPESEQNRTEAEKKDIGARAPSKYAFESGIIRLTEKHLTQWKGAFSALDVPAELIGLTAWANQQGPERWFQAVSGALTKRNREITAGKQQEATSGRHQRPAVPQNSLAAFGRRAIAEHLANSEHAFGFEQRAGDSSEAGGHEVVRLLPPGRGGGS